MPRSGSTLLQKIIMTSPDVSSVSEPWINLPLSDIFEPKTKAWYNKTVALRGLSGLESTLAKHSLDIHTALGYCVNSLYTRVAHKGAKYFIDKTPRYYGIVPFLKKAFPTAKFIYLLRSPAEVLSSKIQKNDNRLPPLKYALMDTITATRKLVEAKSMDTSSLCLKFADLTDNTAETIFRLEEHLSITLDVSKLGAVELRGDFGDVRARNSSAIERSKQSDWTRSVSTLCRYLVFSHMLNKVPSAFYDLMGTSRLDHFEMLKVVYKRLAHKPRVGMVELLRSVARS